MCLKVMFENISSNTNAICCRKPKLHYHCQTLGVCSAQHENRIKDMQLQNKDAYWGVTLATSFTLCILWQ